MKTFRTATESEYLEIMAEILKWYEESPVHHLFYDDCDSKRPSLSARLAIGELLANQKGLSLYSQSVIEDGLKYERK